MTDFTGNILDAITEILETRKGADPNESYVASLYDKGLNEILKKIGEEATEVVLAAKDGENKKIIYEVADLWFHTLVMLSYCDLDHSAVLDELERRFGLSGLLEKASRVKD